MKLNNLIKNLYGGVAILCASLTFASCEQGVVLSEAPENVYSDVGVSYIQISAREWFKNQMYAVNWNEWKENYIDTQIISTSNDFSYLNTSSNVVTLNDGTKVQPGETVTVKCTKTEEACDEAPGGKLYVYNMYAVDHATYTTPNAGHLFDGSKFTGDFELLSAVNNRAEKIVLPIRKNELIGEIYLVNYNYCDVEPVDAPTLGIPADFTGTSQRYLVKNITHRPAGVEQYQRMYEIRLTFLPGRKV